jgi:subtilisin family serine protease
MAYFVAAGQRIEYTLSPLATAAAAGPKPLSMAAVARGARGAQPAVDPVKLAGVISSSPVMASRVSDPSRLAVVHMRSPGAGPASTLGIAPAAQPPTSAVTLLTETVIAEGVRQADLAAAKNAGATLVEEGLDGKVLLRVESTDKVFEIVDLLLAREVGSVTPNFIRRVARPARSAAAGAWAHAKIGVPAAWAITKGKASIRVAVLDEGTDTSHPSLKPAVVAERDFIGGNGSSAMPDGDDAHGTACAGVVLSRDATFPGVAPRCSLIAVRIAMGDGSGGWVIDDFSTADAIDWAWRQGADVLSNSWGGGAPNDAISRAFGRARTQGRNGRGALVCIAATNEQRAISFPGSLPGYVTVGASTPDDERKTKTSADGENWWGSNFGPAMSLLAPGVFIWTTDISGARGYDPTDFTKTFNGTSSATPHVAGAIALLLRPNPALSAPTARNLLTQTVKRLAGQTGWTPELGFGRLDVAKAVAAARDAGLPAKPKAKPKAKKKPAKKAAKPAKKTTAKGAKKAAAKRAAKRSRGRSQASRR